MTDDFGPPVANTWAMPPYRHLPGRTPKPDDGPAHAMARRAPARTDPQQWQSHDAYLYGFVLFRGEYYWEAHEVWEAVWQSCRPNSRERFLLQALIQLANAELKQRLGQVSAAGRIRVHAAKLLREVVVACDRSHSEQPFMGVHVARLLHQIDAPDISQ